MKPKVNAKINHATMLSINGSKCNVWVSYDNGTSKEYDNRKLQANNNAYYVHINGERLYFTKTETPLTETPLYVYAESYGKGKSELTSIANSGMVAEILKEIKEAEEVIEELEEAEEVIEELEEAEEAWSDSYEAYSVTLSNCKLRKNTYLWGAAGAGKSYLAKQVAKDLGLTFYATGRINEKSDLFGYGNALGEYVPTTFYHAWVKGGVFLLDEMDRSDGTALTCLNMALANGECDFPTQGMIEKHPNFVCIATGNTNMRGNDITYTAGEKQDGSVSDRFLFWHMVYDKDLELELSGNNSDLVDFIHSLRDSNDMTGLNHIFSYRAIINIVEMENSGLYRNLETILKLTVLGDVEPDDICSYYNNDLYNNKYMQALHNICESL